MLFRDLLFLGSVALSFGWLAHLCISDKNFNIKTGFIFVGMLSTQIENVSKKVNY